MTAAEHQAAALYCWSPSEVGIRPGMTDDLLTELTARVLAEARAEGIALEPDELRAMLTRWADAVDEEADEA